ncbi:MAG: DUF4173 domain-containing protein [Kiritimatiellae bacterium]|nr:DUF4173 domain-containing protein [Kiritimatiellia bacterium]
MNSNKDQNHTGADEQSGVSKPPPVPPLAWESDHVIVEETSWHEKLIHNIGERLLGLPVKRLDTLVAILLIVIADMCLYQAPGGTGAACVLLSCAVALYALAGKSITGANLALSVVMLLTSMMMVWHHWWLLGIAGWISIIVLAVKLCRPDWKLPGTLWAAAWTVALAPLKALGHVIATAIRAATAKTDPSTQRKHLPIRVVLIPLAICILFILIFSAANPVVARLTKNIRETIGEWFGYLCDVITIGRVFLWLLWMMVFAALIRPTAKSIFADFLVRLDEKLKTPREEGSNDANYATALVTLISVNIVFLAYNCLDANYMYVKAALPNGITWADYTHAGCGWLTFGLFMSTVVIGVIFRHRLNFHLKAHYLKFLCYVWAVQNIVLAAGTIRRLQMYIDYSGLTHLRIVGIYGSLLVAIGLLVMTRKVYANSSFIWLLHKYVLVFCIAVIVLALTPSNWLCASYNARKIIEGKSRALRPICLKNLSAGALPPLIPLLNYHMKDDDASKGALVRQGIAGILGRHLVKLEKAESNRWPQWQFSSAWALKHLRAAQPDIHAVLVPAHWKAAENRLKQHYDLSEPIAPPVW